MHYRHLGNFSDIVDEARRHQELLPVALPGAETQCKVREVLGWCDRPEEALDVRVERTWEKDGLTGEVITWSVGFGPRTQAWLFKPAGAVEPLPAVLALHDHGGFKYYGKEKIAEGPDAPEPVQAQWYQWFYGGRPWVNALAREGFAVLVHDTFLWGSRKFPFEAMRDALAWVKIPPEMLEAAWEQAKCTTEVASYNYLAGLHEHDVSKYLNLLGTGMPGVVCHEDRIAFNYLHSRPDVLPDNLACMGLSGGGNRAGMLRATALGLKAAVVIGLMTTYAGLLDHNAASHSWMLYPFGWSRYGDWPDLVACQAPAPLLVQYDEEDGAFTPEGMHAAHARLEMLYGSAGDASAYTGQFYPGPHRFDLEMQAAGFAWLKQQLSD